MWWFLLMACNQQPAPATFEWGWERTRVAAVRVWPLAADAAIPRQVEALVISPSADPTVRVEACGVDPDMAVFLEDGDEVACFGEPELVTPIDEQVPAVWQPPEVSFECPYIWGGATFSDDDGEGDYEDSDSPPTVLTCGSMVLLRVAADGGGEEGEVSAVVNTWIDREGYDPTEEIDPATADPRIEIAGGRIEAGEKVLLRFSVAPEWADSGTMWTSLFPMYHWSVEAGQPYGTAISGGAGFDDDGRPYAQTWLRIPDDWHGPLRVAAVRLDPVPVWTQTTLEVP